MIVMDDKLVAIWVLSIAPRCDWMCALRELVPEKKYEVTYRFRYYNDDTVFNSTDVKRWYQGTVSSTRANVLEHWRRITRGMEATSIGPLYEILNSGDLQDFQRRFLECPMIHSRIEP